MRELTSSERMVSAQIGLAICEHFDKLLDEMEQERQSSESVKENEK